MKLLLDLLTLCCVIVFTTSLADSFSNNEDKLEAALSDIEVMLQELKEEKAPVSDGDVLGHLPQPQSHTTPAKAPSTEMEEVLLHVNSANIQKATAEIKAAGGRVKIQMGHDLLIADVPTNIVTTQSFAHSSTHIPNSAPQITQNGAKVYRMYREHLLKPQPEIVKWTEKTAPKLFPHKDPADIPDPLKARGKIAVVVIMVSGPNDLSMSAEEADFVYAQVLSGLTVWTDHAPPDAGLSFVTYHELVKIKASNGPVGCHGTNAECHDVFAIPAIKTMGYNSERELVTAAKTWPKSDTADGAYIAFFSKYRQIHFAYAFESGPIYMQYKNDGWGPGQLDRVFGHETGHVFGAPDEYQEDKTRCDCISHYGQGKCSDTNGNCIACTEQQVKCIMNHNDLGNVCKHTRKHVGWC